MSDTANERPAPTPPTEAPRMVAVRRRSRRRRTQLAPIDWRRIAVLGVMLLCALLLVVDKKLGGGVKAAVDQVRALTGAVRLEVVILAVCGLIWLYLTPGVEDRVIRLFKKATEKKRRGGGRGRRR